MIVNFFMGEVECLSLPNLMKYVKSITFSNLMQFYSLWQWMRKKVFVWVDFQFLQWLNKYGAKDKKFKPALDIHVNT